MTNLSRPSLPTVDKESKDTVNVPRKDHYKFAILYLYSASCF